MAYPCLRWRHSLNGRCSGARRPTEERKVSKKAEFEVVVGCAVYLERLRIEHGEGSHLTNQSLNYQPHVRQSAFPHAQL